MLAKSILFFSALALAAAAPQRGHGGGKGKGCKPRPTVTGAPPTNTNVVDPPASEEIPLPANGGDKELTFPEGLVLKHVALGHGYQNYTCSQDGISTATGALAVLYDVMPFFPGAASGLPSYDSWLSISTTCAMTEDVPLQLDPASTAIRVSGAETQIQMASPFFDPNTPLNLGGVGTLSPIGVHYFDSLGVPTFDVGDDLFKAKKVEAIPAPADASPGQNGEKAVSWLFLEDAGGSINLDYVYRVNTVGGAGHACDVVGEDSTEYAAFYYMYAKA